MTNALPAAAVPQPTNSTRSAMPVVRTPTYVIGHRNPDADSICAAIAYAAFKDAKGERGYLAARCGNSNARIDTILRRFRQPLPVYVSDVSPRVHDLMTPDVVCVSPDATCAEALELIDRHGFRLLPVVDRNRLVIGTVSHTHLGGVFIPRISELRRMRQVTSSLAHITRALRGRPLCLVDKDSVEQLFVRVGTMDIGSFWSVSIRDNIPAAQSIVIVGDRTDIQRRAIELGVRALIITGSLEFQPDILQLAKARGVSVIISPYDSATSAWVVRSASTLERVIDRTFHTVRPNARIADIRKLLAPPTAHVLMVTNDDGALVGLISKSDILKPVQTQLVLVDHNEMTQAVPGAEEVVISEVIDHHRVGALNTAQPILFINEPVGSTCTIIADMFRRERLRPSPEIAGILMSGVISDTLHLKGPTTTDKDAIVLAWLSEISGVASKDLADEIFNSGSVILTQPADVVVRSDFKIYREDGVRFAVSQVEELGFGNFWQHASAIADALQALCAEDRLVFAALLVTDIDTQDSLLLVKGDGRVVQKIDFPRLDQGDVFECRGIVSRKKQLLPYLSTLLKGLATEGAPVAPAR